MVRFFDIFFSILGLFLLMPIFIIISVAIKVESKGPILFRQKRIGRNSLEFLIFKFRSMYAGSENKRLLTIGLNDGRITHVGKFLRKYKLDELPQFFNVLKGDMSIVGPRPEVEKYVTLYTENQREILKARPGITDYASVAFSNENEILSQVEDPETYYIEILMPKKIELNLKFINDYSLIHYFKIILLTIKKILSN